MNASVENVYIKIWLEDEVLVCQYKKDSIISIGAAREIVKLRLDFQKGKTYKCLCYAGQLSVITPDARKYLAGKEGYEGVEKLAIIVVNASPVKTVLGNLFIGINKPVQPTKLFRTKEEGLKWLFED